MGDWTSATYIISQILVIFAFGCLGATYFYKKRAVVLMLVITCNILLGIAYSLLSAWVGLGICALGLCRDTTSYFINAKRKPQDKNKITKLDCGLLALWTAVALTITIFTHDGFLTWFAFFATVVFMVSIWQKNVLIYRFLGILHGACWIVYNTVIQNLMGVILESCVLVAVIVGLVLYWRKLKLTKRKTDVTVIT